MIGMQMDAKQFAKLQRIFEKMPENMDRARLLALTKSALQVQNLAKSPAYAPYKKGNLRRSITNRVNKNSAQVGTNLIYARVREFNTKSRPLGYLRPALADSKGKIMEIFQKYFRKVLSDKPIA